MSARSECCDWGLGKIRAFGLLTSGQALRVAASGMAGKGDALFAELAAQAKEGDHEKALATADKSAHAARISSPVSALS